jgi:hypothetical protein
MNLNAQRVAVFCNMSDDTDEESVKTDIMTLADLLQELMQWLGQTHLGSLHVNLLDFIPPHVTRHHD